MSNKLISNRFNWILTNLQYRDGVRSDPSDPMVPRFLCLRTTLLAWRRSRDLWIYKVRLHLFQMVQRRSLRRSYLDTGFGHTEARAGSLTLTLLIYSKHLLRI